MIEKGCDPNQPDDNGQTALSYAEAIGLQDWLDFLNDDSMQDTGNLLGEAWEKSEIASD